MLKRNKKLLLKAAKRIETVPQSYDQSTWASESDKSPCGTVACLAGEIIIASERSVKDGIDKLFSTNAVSIVARELAGLEWREAGSLFFDPVAWPEPFGDRYYKAKTQRGRANAAAALLRHLADGGEV